ncbi:hypothetical protein P171DRAFT_392751, partial [Karstenula rhodostoma CBS 690.94]
MAHSVAERCRTCISTLRLIVSMLTTTESLGRISCAQATEQLERLSLWTGNIGALHPPTSSLSVEARLREADDVRHHVSELLDDLSDASAALYEIVSGQRDGETEAQTDDVSVDEGDVEVSEEIELLQEIDACITRLFRVSSLIRQATPSSPFDKALSRNRYRFNDQFDIAHVGEKFPKLAREDNHWLQTRLGRAITQRRHYLSYTQDHRDKLEGDPARERYSEAGVTQSIEWKQKLPTRLLAETTSQPSTYHTKASTLGPGQITRSMLSTEADSDPEDDARSYTTIARSLDGALESAVTVKIPKLEDLQIGSNKDIECPFCFRVKRFKNNKVWRRHVFEDLRSYVCTFSECDAPLFGNINDWFSHEMKHHRVDFKCSVCQDRSFSNGTNSSGRDKYITHIQRRHPQFLEADGLELLLQSSQRPVEHILARACPLCFGWENRVIERAQADGSLSKPHIEEDEVSVLPHVFKRHVAAHLEELALFAIPVGSALGDNVDSNAAIE